MTITLTVDERTEELSDAALTCRAKGHRWEEKALSRSRFRELFSKGLTEENEFCIKCGTTDVKILDVASGEIVEKKRKYPSGGQYLLPKGSGRLSRSAARVARFARMYRKYG